MKSEFKAKFLQHLLRQQKDEGFTLIELLVVIIIIGILSAIALPSFLNQANKARESEGKQYIGSLNRAQQSYFLEKQRFTSTMSNLGIGLQTDTANYVYTIDDGSATDNNFDSAVFNLANAKNSSNLKSFVGLVDLVDSGDGSTTLAILCRTEESGSATTDGITYHAAANDTEPNCDSGDGYIALE